MEVCGQLTLWLLYPGEKSPSDDRVGPRAGLDGVQKTIFLHPHRVFSPRSSAIQPVPNDYTGLNKINFRYTVQHNYVIFIIY